MRTILNIMTFLLLIVFLNSCTDDPAKPEIINFELGVNNSNTGYIGTDIHAEGEIIAEGKIDKIKLKIHPENGSGNSWEIDTTYTSYSGLKNTEFHEHFEIPLSAAQGTYHFDFIVIDKEGQSTEIERDLKVEILVDNVMPVITVTEQPSSNYTSGQTIKIAGKVTDNIGIAGLYIALVKLSQGLKDSDVTNENTISMLHMHDFEEANDVSFSCSLKVGADKDNDSPQKTINWQSGDYYILVKAPNLGGGSAYSVHYPVKITL
ncbi:MAG: DUF4625 domain-containing protein [Deltaproteobacteria bacterium]